MTNWDRLLELGAWSANGHTFFGREKVGQWANGEFVINDAGVALIKAADVIEFPDGGDPTPAPADAPAPDQTAPAPDAAASAPAPKARARKAAAPEQVDELEQMLKDMR